jgi:hypothetical protein
VRLCYCGLSLSAHLVLQALQAMNSSLQSMLAQLTWGSAAGASPHMLQGTAAGRPSPARSGEVQWQTNCGKESHNNIVYACIRWARACTGCRQKGRTQSAHTHRGW